jgi:2,5-diamino-6-(ribosylamino)-4(3H)-pyrimidinone 5'-phosphate reductase
MSLPHERPFVYINMAMTVDGKITSAAREHPRFASRRDRAQMDRLRADADALMVAAGTVRADNPAFHIRTKSIREQREADGKPDAPHRILVSKSAEIPEDSRFFDGTHGGDSILVTTEETAAENLERFTGRAEIWRLGRHAVDLRATLSKLHSIGVQRLLVEGGGELNWSLLELDLVDELHVTIVPALLGGRSAPTLLGGAGWPMKQQRRLRLLEFTNDDGELFCRYSIEAEPQPGKSTQ